MAKSIAVTEQCPMEIGLNVFKRKVETENLMASFQRGGAVQRIAATFREDHHQDPDAAAP